jgi:hypothetical protein
VATSDPRMVFDILDVLDRHGVEYAVLHGAERIRAGTVVSDLDIVVSDDPGALVAGLVDDLGDVGLTPVMDWNYDLGGTRTVFLAADGGQDGIQLDLLADPDGRGRYGVRSNLLLAGRHFDGGVPVVAARDEAVYLLSKRLMKGDRTRVAELAAAAAGDPELPSRVPQLLVPSVATAVQAVLDGRRPKPPVRPVRRLATGVRLARRLTRPVGFWFHIPDRRVAEAVRDRVARFIPHVTLATVDDRRSAAVWRRWRTRLGPGIALSTGKTAAWGADAVIDAPTPDEALASIVPLMRERTLRRLTQ